MIGKNQISHFICISTLVILTQLNQFKAHSQKSATHQAETSGRNTDHEPADESGEIVNRCCRREPKFLTIANGIGDNQVRVDVGHCRQTCDQGKGKPLKREEFDRYLREYPHLDPIQIFLTLQSGGSMSDLLKMNNSDSSGENVFISSSGYDGTSKLSCISTSESTCQPSSTRREKYFSLTGDEEVVDIIESCECATTPQTCQKTMSPIRVHVGTPYERIVDVGRCLGPCSILSNSNPNPSFTIDMEVKTVGRSRTLCRSVRNRTITLDGPNGAECMQVIDECECVGDCFRSRGFHKVFDYTNVFEYEARNRSHQRRSSTSDDDSHEISNENEYSGDSENLLTNATPEPEITPVSKLIDMGRCSGSCDGSDSTSKCLIRSNTDGNCLSALYGGRSKCVPTKFLSHTYMDRNGQRHTLVSVTGCGCR